MSRLVSKFLWYKDMSRPNWTSALVTIIRKTTNQEQDFKSFKGLKACLSMPFAGIENPPSVSLFVLYQ